MVNSTFGRNAQTETENNKYSLLVGESMLAIIILNYRIIIITFCVYTHGYDNNRCCIYSRCINWSSFGIGIGNHSGRINVAQQLFSMRAYSEVKYRSVLYHKDMTL